MVGPEIIRSVAVLVPMICRRRQSLSAAHALNPWRLRFSRPCIASIQRTVNGTLERSNFVQPIFEHPRFLCDPYPTPNTARLTFRLDDPQDIVELNIAFFKGDERTRTFLVKSWNEEGVKTTRYFTSSGTITGFENFEIDTEETVKLQIVPSSPNTLDWLSIVEVSIIFVFRLVAFQPTRVVQKGWRGYLACLVRNGKLHVSPLFLCRSPLEHI